MRVDDENSSGVSCWWDGASCVEEEVGKGSGCMSLGCCDSSGFDKETHSWDDSGAEEATKGI